MAHTGVVREAVGWVVDRERCRLGLYLFIHFNFRSARWAMYLWFSFFTWFILSSSCLIHTRFPMPNEPDHILSIVQTEATSKSHTTSTAIPASYPPPSRTGRPTPLRLLQSHAPFPQARRGSYVPSSR